MGQSLTMAHTANIALTVALCCLGLAVAQRNIHQGLGTGSQQSADYRRLPLTPYHGHGYNGIARVYHGHGTNRLNGYFGGFGVGYGNDPFLDEREIYPEWFEVDKADQCDDVPENVNTGRIRDVCGDDDLGQRFCVCVKRRTAYGRNNYEPICGECRDPCSLRFVPDRFGPRRDDFNGNRNNNPETKK